MTLEESFVGLATMAFDLIESLNSITVFGLGAGTWIYVFIIISLLISLLFIFLPFDTRYPNEQYADDTTEHEWLEDR